MSCEEGSGAVHHSGLVSESLQRAVEAQVALKCTCDSSFFFSFWGGNSDCNRKVLDPHESTATNTLHLWDCIRKVCLQSARSNSHGHKYISRVAAAGVKNAGGGQGWGQIRSGDQRESGQTLGWNQGCRRSSQPASISPRWQRQRGREARQVFSNLWGAAGWLQGETVLVSSQTEMRSESFTVCAG